LAHDGVHGIGGLLGGFFDVGVFEDDGGGFAAEFEDAGGISVG